MTSLLETGKQEFVLSRKNGRVKLPQLQKLSDESPQVLRHKQVFITRFNEKSFQASSSFIRLVLY